MKRIDWLNETRLGEIPDEELAALLGVPVRAVANARCVLGIPKHNDQRHQNPGRPTKAAIRHMGRRGKRPNPDWQSDPEIGKVIDRIIAERHGISQNAVCKYRRDNGIPRCVVPLDERTSTFAQIIRDPILGKAPDAEIARKYGVCRETVRLARQWLKLPRFKSERPEHRPWHDDPDIGRLPDRAVAERHGLSTSSIGSYRHRMGIPAAPSQPRLSPIWTDPDLGRVVDQVIADRYGDLACRVAQIRKKLGIAPCRKHRKEVAA